MFIIACSISYLYHLNERAQASRFNTNCNSPSNLAIPSASYLKGAREEKLAQSNKTNVSINIIYLTWQYVTLYPSVICCFRELHAFQMNIMKISFRKSFIQYIYVRGGQGVVIEIWRATFVRQMISD